MPDARHEPSLRSRLALAFVAVAVGAVAALAAVMLVATRSETSRASEQQRQQTATETADELARAYRTQGAWDRADLTAAIELAARADATLGVLDATGTPVFTERPGRGPQVGRGRHRITHPITVDGRRVGTVELGFRDALTRSESLLRDSLVRAALLGSAIAIAIALLGAVLVSRRLVLPLQRLARAARRVEAGDFDTRVDGAPPPGELGELSRAFDRMAETLGRQEHSRRRLAGELAHELRTPVTVLRGNLEELLDTGEEPTAERLASLHEEVMRLDTLIEQLDALAQAEAPVAAIDRSNVDLASLVHAQVKALAPQLQAKQLVFAEHLDHVVVHADRARIGQVIANLLSNALKFTPDGGRIEVTVSGGEPDARIDVTDTGPGIPEDEREQVFERFWRGSASTSVAGRGVGLAVVAQIVHAHGGTVTAATDGRSRGARFTVTLPRD